MKKNLISFFNSHESAKVHVCVEDRYQRGRRGFLSAIRGIPLTSTRMATHIGTPKPPIMEFLCLFWNVRQPSRSSVFERTPGKYGLSLQTNDGRVCISIFLRRLRMIATALLYWLFLDVSVAFPTPRARPRVHPGHQPRSALDNALDSTSSSSSGTSTLYLPSYSQLSSKNHDLARTHRALYKK